MQKYVALTLLLTIFAVSPRLLRAEEEDSGPSRWEVEVTERTAMSPFGEVSYFVRSRRGRTMVGMSRSYIGGVPTERETRLASETDGTELLEELGRCLSASGAAGRLLAEGVSLETPPHGRVRKLTLESRFASVDIIVREQDEACAAAVVEFVTDRVTFGLFQHPFWEAGEYGQLRIDADVAARVELNGVPLRGLTPLSDVRVAPGRHTVRWLHEDSGSERVEEVEVHAGQLTAIRVRLTDAAPE